MQKKVKYKKKIIMTYVSCEQSNFVKQDRMSYISTK